VSSSAPDSPLRDLEGPGDEWLARVRRADEPRRNGCLGPYEILEEVGRGGQGIVFRARQSSTGREIALKRLGTGIYSDAASRRRFEREIELAANLAHPGIVAVHGVEQVDGVPLLVMEWIGGQPLTAWAASLPRDRGGLELKLRLFLQVCEAVQHAHARGVIHRDLKPSNVLVDASGRARLLDFGLASRQDAASGSTRTLGFVGTPAYAPPEHFTEGAAPLDVRSDVYSLGVLLYECLTGVRPFRSDLLPELMAEIAQREPERPSRAARGLDAERDALVLRALEKRPEDRYPTVHALAEDLRRYLEGRTLQAVPPRAGYLLRKWVRRNRLVFGFSLALAASVLISAAVALRQAAVIADERDAVRFALQDVERQAARSQALQAFYHDAIHAAVNPTRGTPTRSVRDVLEYEAAHAEERLGAHPEVAVETLIQIAEDFRWLDDHARARELLTEALALLDALPAPDQNLRADLLGKLGLNGFHLGHQVEGIAQLEESVRLFAQLPSADPVKHALALGRLGEAQKSLGSLDAAAENLQHARALAWGARDPTTIMLTTGNLAPILIRRYQFEAAEKMLLESLAFIEQAAPTDAFVIASARNSLASLFSETGRFERAVELQQGCVDVHESLLEPQHGEVLKHRLFLGRYLLGAGRHEAASAHFEDIIASTNDPFHVSAARLGRGRCALAAGDAQQALPHLRLAQPVIVQLAAQGDSLRIELACALFSALVRAERYEEAEQQYVLLADELRAGQGHGLTAKPEELRQAFQDVLVIGYEQEFDVLIDETLAGLGERLPESVRKEIEAVRPR